MLNMRPIKTLQIYFLFSLIAISSPLRAENLADVYELALKNDPLLKAAEATYRAGKENRKIFSGLCYIHKKLCWFLF